MTRTSLSFAIAAASLVLAFLAAPAQAQASRTWVSGVGDDANPCSRTAPCKTFAVASSKTALNGEINCLDPGGFGAVTITKSITIDCHEIFASILFSGTNGINIPFNSFAATTCTRPSACATSISTGSTLGSSASASPGAASSRPAWPSSGLPDRRRFRRRRRRDLRRAHRRREALHLQHDGAE